VSFVAGVISVAGIAELWSCGAYQNNFEEYQSEFLRREAESHLHYICQDQATFPTLEDMSDAFVRESTYNNVSYIISRYPSGEERWSNTSQEARQSPYTYKAYVYRDVLLNSVTQAYETVEYMVVMYVDPEFAKADELQQLNAQGISIYNMKWRFVGVGVGAILFGVVSFVWLLCNAGHRRGKEGITPSILSGIYLDILTAGFVAGGVLLLFLGENLLSEFRGDLAYVLILALGGAVTLVWCTIYLCEFALRLKLEKTWRFSLIYVTARWAWRFLRAALRLTWKVLLGIPGILNVVGLLTLTTLVEFCVIFGIIEDFGVFVLWLMEKALIVPIVLYCALAFKKLCRASEELAGGNSGYKLSTRYLMWDFKKQGENLNRLGEGIAKAVEQRMRSERLKTELITNVSHDIKTPLTSIINYADLLGNLVQGQEALGNEEREAQMAEYSEVLLRQSKRLRKLLDDLVDASKATTGNLEVELQPCVIGVLLSQTVGEYEPRLEERRLELHVSQPEEELQILADGRHLWRVFDNLMNNICKYAQENSRVYINVERHDGKAAVIFRNISQYELNISAEELEERFVRGDASRHMEGSGLGLSIARSLVELQGGGMQIVTDGDLFKVILEFDVLNT
ncbi:MAG: HAMP domain-containing histidine kinase, partial [Butyrivibrio sp.]|nr:HAMP domain-containing histidine kinase [Butyrivibrio sp.]